jgi:hypothetical protein
MRQAGEECAAARIAALVHPSDDFTLPDVVSALSSVQARGARLTQN